MNKKTVSFMVLSSASIAGGMALKDILNYSMLIAVGLAIIFLLAAGVSFGKNNNRIMQFKETTGDTYGGIKNENKTNAQCINYNYSYFAQFFHREFSISIVLLGFICFINLLFIQG